MGSWLEGRMIWVLRWLVGRLRGWPTLFVESVVKKFWGGFMSAGAVPACTMDLA